MNRKTHYMELQQRMGLRVRSSYEDIDDWIRKDVKGVPYPDRKSLQCSIRTSTAS